MKIQRFEQPNPVKLKTLNAGDVFEMNEYFWMLTSNELDDNGNLTIVCLEDGEIAPQDPDDEVNPYPLAKLLPDG